MKNMTYLEYNDEKSHKFWKIEIVDNTFNVTYGKAGTNGQSSTKEFENAEKAQLEATKIIKQKMKKGYAEAQVKETAEPQQEEAEIDYFKELKKFDNKYGGESYCQSFYIDSDKNFFESWLDSDEVSKEKCEEYGQSMKVFAGADGTGAMFAFWFTKGNTNLNKAPIIVFGSEGAVEIVAENIKDLIKMLSFGEECMDGSFYRSCDDEDEYEEGEDCFSKVLDYLPNFLTFRKWMKDELGINPIKKWKIDDESEEINKLIKKANKKYKKSFDKWQYQFYPDPKDEEAIYTKEQLEKYETEREVILKNIEKNPTADLYFELAENGSNHDNINFNQIVEYLKSALDIEKNHQASLKELAYKLSYEEPSKSLEYNLKLLKLNPDSFENYDDIACSYEILGDFEKALDFYSQHIIKKPNSYGGYSQKHIIKICKELKQDPIIILENTLKISESKETYKALQNLTFKKNKYEESLEYYKKYNQLSSNIQSFEHIKICTKYYDKEEYDIGIKAFKYAISEMDNYNSSRKAEANNYIGVMYILGEKNREKALTYYKKACELDSDEEIYKENYNFTLKAISENKS